MAGVASPRHAASVYLEPRGPVTRIVFGRLVVVTVLVGVGAGVGGALVTLLLHLLQNLAFGYTEESFLTGVEQASGLRRVVTMTLGGLIVGVGWCVLRKYVTVVPITDGLRDRDPRVPFFSTIADAILQVIAVALGGSIGREGAPRQVGAVIAVWIAAYSGLTVTQQRRLLACGAGAGLAAVYNVPLAGALFTLEILLVSFALADVLAALLTSAIAVGVAWIALGNKPTYDVDPFVMSNAVLVFGILIGPVAGLVGVVLSTVMDYAQSHQPRGWRIPVCTTSVFAAVGLLSVEFPQLLGNGKGPAQLAFDGALALPLFLALLVLKPAVTAASLASGAKGGTLTPALATGAMLGALMGGLWSHLWPGSPAAAYALICAAAVLATTHRAPFTAIVLVLELTHTGNALLVPLIIAVVVAYMLSSRLMAKRMTDPV